VTIDQAQLNERLLTVQERIDGVMRSSQRNDDVTLIVVSKFHSAELVRALHTLGVRDFGENRHQEAKSKAAETSDLDITWHFVGQLQSNKARQAARYASAIHSLDRTAVVDALGTFDGSVDGFVQVNMTDDPDRGGVAPHELEALTERILETSTIHLRGIMAVAPLEEEPASAFERLAGYAARLQAVAPHATAISAGMTHDFEIALAHGATHLRIGSAITGNRA